MALIWTTVRAVKPLENGKNGGKGRRISNTNINQRSIWSWAFYDWANSAYATTVMAGFFPIFFKQYWSHGIETTQSTYVLGLTNSASGLAIAVMAPFLGALADQGFGKKIFLGAFTLLGALTTASLAGVDLGQWHQAAWLYGVSNFAFGGALVFYDAMLVDVSSREAMDKVSSWGYSAGYLGGGLLFLINVLMYIKPNMFGLTDGPHGIRASFVSVSAWWLLFSLPLFLWVKEQYRPARLSLPQTLRKSGLSLGKTFASLRQHKPLLFFLAAYFIYIDGVNTIITMAVDYGMALGFDPSALITALLIVQFVGFPAAILVYKISERIGAHRGVLMCLAVYAVITLFAVFMTQSWHFYVLAAAIGLVQGGVQALSRSIYAKMIPPQEAGEFFGFFNLLTKFSAIIGPFLVGMVSLMTGQPRWSIFVILLMFLGGSLLLLRVPPDYRVTE